MRILLIILVLILHSSLYPVTLPVKDARITSTFGESRQDHFHNGVDFGGGEQDVQAIKDARIIFYFDKKDFPFQAFMGSGNYVILQHRDNLRSYYMHLKTGTVNKTNDSIREGAFLGRTSDTGHSYGIHLHLSVEKVHPLEILNPLKLYTDVITDKIKPRIEQFFIRVDNGSPLAVYDTLRLNEGNQISLYLKCYDLFQSMNNKVAPYKITCYVNNEKFREYVFEKLIIKNNYYYLPPSFSFSDVYYKNDIYYLGDLAVKEKKYDISIVVEDLYGNQARTERHILIKK